MSASSPPTAREAAMRRALRWERRVHRAAHPLAYPLALVFRRLGPVLSVPGIGHIVNDAAVARAMLLDTEHFSKNGPGSAGELITQVMGDYALLNLEGEPHRELRALLIDVFSPSAVRAIIDELWRPRLDRAVADLRDGAHVELVRLATVLTGLTMRHLLGLEAGDDEASLRTFELGERLVSVVRLQNGRLSPRVVARSRQRFLTLTDEIVAAIPSAPAHSIIGRLRIAGFGSDQVRGVCAALLLTGTDTVSAALPRAVALISDADQWNNVNDATLRRSMVDECLRVITPSPVMLRSVEHDTSIDGHRFRQGRRAAIMTYLAVRDFDGGDAFCPGREVPPAARGLQFGAGIHHCIGFTLACAELDLWLEQLAAVSPLRVNRRAPARRVLIPRYRVLEIERTP